MKEVLTQKKEQCAENLSENLQDMRLTLKEEAKYMNESPRVVSNWLREWNATFPLYWETAPATILKNNGSIDSFVCQDDLRLPALVCYCF